MRLATWNINHINKRLPLLLAWLDATKPDLVALQEIKVVDKSFTRASLEAAGDGCVVVGERTWNGVASLAREAEPILVHRALPGDAADRQARYVEAAVNGLLVASLYLPNGNPCPGPKFDDKMAWFERLFRHGKTEGASDHAPPGWSWNDVAAMDAAANACRPLFRA